MAATLDTLRLSRRFRDAGVPEPQAEIFADAFREQHEAGVAQLATKADIEALRLATKADIEAVRLSTKADIEAAKTDLVRWFAGVMIAQGLGVVVATVTLIKLLSGGP